MEYPKLSIDTSFNFNTTEDSLTLWRNIEKLYMP